MPNWCENRLRIEGDSKAIDRLLEMVKTKDTEFDFNAVIPYPKVYADLDAVIDIEWPHGGKGFNSGGYQWCVEHWGTKWNACDAYSSKSADGKTASMNFDTAWSPSLPITAALSLAFPELVFTHKYEEGGADFSGLSVFEAGQLMNSAEGRFDDYPTSEHIRDDDDGISV